MPEGEEVLTDAVAKNPDDAEGDGFSLTTPAIELAIGCAINPRRTRRHDPETNGVGQLRVGDDSNGNMAIEFFRRALPTALPPSP